MFVVFGLTIIHLMPIFRKTVIFSSGSAKIAQSERCLMRFYLNILPNFYYLLTACEGLIVIYQAQGSEVRTEHARALHFTV